MVNLKKEFTFSLEENQVKKVLPVVFLVLYWFFSLIPLAGQPAKNSENFSKGKSVELSSSALEIIGRPENTVVSVWLTTLQIFHQPTYLHSLRVQLYSAAIAQALDLPQAESARIEIAAQLHDIGKLRLPLEILNKTGKLSEGEYETFKKHSHIGWEILVKTGLLAKFSDGAMDHHERFDGSGYPKGLKGNSISLAGRIIAVADSFDTMTSRQLYTNPKTFDEAVEEIKRLSGKDYDPAVVDAFLKNLSRMREIFALDHE